MLSLIGGIAFALTTPPMDLTILAWPGLGLLAYALDADEPDAIAGRRAWLRAATRGLAFGFGASLIAHRFVPAVIARFTPLPYVAGVVALVLLALSEGIPWAVVAMARRALVRVGVPRPVAFAIAVYAAAFVPAVFPWTPAAGVTRWPAVVQLADLIGERGVAGLLALSAGLLALAVREGRDRTTHARAWLAAALGVALPIVMAVHGVARMAAVDNHRAKASTIRVGLIQPAIEATTRWDVAAAPGILAKLTELTRVAESHGAVVSVWPESAYPYVLSRGTTSVPLGEGSPFQNGARGPLILGAITTDANLERYNAVLGARADGSFTSEYDKLHLLWFGEEVPFAGSWPWLRRAFVRGVGMVPGDHPVRIDAGPVRAGVMVCFEDILPDAGREAASVNPNLLVNLSNDAWFVGSAESELHLRMSTLRAVELRRDLVRAVNVGASALVDATGRVVRENDGPTAGSFVVKAALLDGPPTVYAVYSDAPTILLCAAVALGAFVRAKHRRTKRIERRISE